MKQTDYIVFGPRFTEELWLESNKEAPMMRYLCERCLHTVILRQSARKLIEDYPTICTECKDADFKDLPVAPQVIVLADLEQAFNSRRKAALN